MRYTKVRYYFDGDQFSHASVVHSDGTKLKIKKGSKYIVEPFNPNKQKNRGRIVIVMGVDEQQGLARVRYDDNGRPGKVPFDELKKIGKETKVKKKEAFPPS